MFRCAIRVSALAIAITIVYATSSLAADTIETFDEGAFDTEFYIGAGGFALDRADQTLGASTGIGYGLLDRFSGYVAFGVETNTYLAEGHSGAAFGLIGTVLDTNHFDADLFGDISADGEAMSEVVATRGSNSTSICVPIRRCGGSTRASKRRSPARRRKRKTRTPSPSTKPTAR